MPAYFLFDSLEVTDPAGLARYAEAVGKTVTDHGGRFVAVEAEPDVFEGHPALTSATLIQFPDLAAARGWYDSAEYQPLKELRHRSVRNTAVLFVGRELPGPGAADRDADQ